MQIGNKLEQITAQQFNQIHPTAVANIEIKGQIPLTQAHYSMKQQNAIVQPVSPAENYKGRAGDYYA